MSYRTPQPMYVSRYPFRVGPMNGVHSTPYIHGFALFPCYWPKAENAGGSGAEPLRSATNAPWRSNPSGNEPGRAAANRAFTLIEMLISLAIVSCIVTMVYGSYAATSRSLDVYSHRMACCERAHLVLRMMARQIRCAYMPLAEPDPAQTKTDRQGPPTAPITAFRGDSHEPRGEILSLTTTGGFGLGPEGPVGISRVAYRYDRPSAILSISCEPGTCRPDSLRDSGTWRPAMKGVTKIELEFHDGRQWQPRWDSRQAGRLPQAVKIGLAVTEESGRVHHYATTVPILCRTASQSQQIKTPVGQP